MTDVDTNSYLKPAPLPAQKSVLDQVGQYQEIEKNRIGIDQSKLKLANDQFQILNKEISTLLANPNTTADDVVNKSQDFVKLGLVPADMHAKFISQLPTQQQVAKNPNALHQFLENTLTRAMTTMEAVNFHYGAPGTFNNGQQTTPVLTSPKFGMKAAGTPIQNQLPPTTETTTPGGTQLLGPQSPQTVPGTVGTPQPLPVGPINNPAIKGQSSNFGGNVIGASVEPPQPTQTAQSQQPRGPMTSQPPMFDEGKKMLAEDQALATNKLTAIKPALQALPLLKDLRSGPTTSKFNEIAAALKANGIIPTDTAHDKTAVYQEVTKKLAQYVSSNPVGQRSDAAQTLAEAASPSPKTQISPALIKLTKDAVILDRVQAARAGAFEGNDYSKYGNHRSTFPASVDERAFGLDLMEPEERKALLTDMKKKQKTFEGKRFWKSLDIVDKQGLIDTGG